MAAGVQELHVHYRGWGKSTELGTLVDDGHHLLFAYSPQAIDAGLELSPLHLKLRHAAYGDFPAYLYRLPGLLYDCLPDGWGMLLMERFFRQQGQRHITPLQRLAFIGDQAMGALAFIPATTPNTPYPDWTLQDLRERSARVLTNEAEHVLAELLLTGGSPQGARPKALVQYDADNKQISTRPDSPGSAWIIKFPVQGEHAEVCAIEQLYMEMAKDCGLWVPDSRWFALDHQQAAFGMQRFDRTQAGLRVPVHSLAGLLHIDFRVAGATDYTTLLRATRLMTRDERQVEQAYARAVFNVIFHNRDDHPKNFAWVLNQEQKWQLSPAFDLTFSEGPGGQHAMDVCGQGQHMALDHLLQLAQEGGVDTKLARQIIERTRDVADTFARRVTSHAIRQKTARDIQARIQQCSARM